METLATEERESSWGKRAFACDNIYDVFFERSPTNVSNDLAELTVQKGRYYRTRAFEEKQAFDTEIPLSRDFAIALLESAMKVSCKIGSLIENKRGIRTAYTDIYR